MVLVVVVVKQKGVIQMVNKELKMDILTFLLEQELRDNKDGSYAEWCIEQIEGLIKKHGDAK